MESLNTQNNKNANKDTKSAGKPKMKDNNDDNEFATPVLKGSFSVESKQNDRDHKNSSETPNTGSADKVETQTSATASMIEQKLNARIEELAGLVEKAGEKIQRLGEALCRIGDQVGHLPERKFGMKKGKSAKTNADSAQTNLN